MFTVYGAKIDNSFETSKRIRKKDTNDQTLGDGIFV